jgi:ribonuclease HI
MMVVTKLNRENYFEGNPGSSNTQVDSKAWCSLWKVQVPSKIRVFLWRLAQQSLPTADVLEHRNMAQSIRCSLCGEADSWRHSLIECNMAASVWILSDDEMVEHMRAIGEPNAKNWLFKLIESLSHVQFTRMTVTLWAIWTARRKAIHEEIFQSPLSTHCFINSYLEELKAVAQPRRTAPGGNSTARQARWVPPPYSVPKINVDAAVSRTEGHGVAAAFCRDSNGAYLGASAVVFAGISDPATLEALAVREALALAEDLSLDQAYIVSDCKTVISDIKDGSMGKYGSVISEIKHRSNIFQSCKFAYESRASNFEAHNLARHMISSGIGRHLWLDTPYSDSIPVNIIIDQ